MNNVIRGAMISSALLVGCSRESAGPPSSEIATTIPAAETNNLATWPLELRQDLEVSLGTDGSGLYENLSRLAYSELGSFNIGDRQFHVATLGNNDPARVAKFEPAMFENLAEYLVNIININPEIYTQIYALNDVNAQDQYFAPHQLPFQIVEDNKPAYFLLVDETTGLGNIHGSNTPTPGFTVAGSEVTASFMSQPEAEVIATEICQSVVRVAAKDAAGEYVDIDVKYLNLFGQEQVCNGLGSALAAAAFFGIPYEVYEPIQRDLILKAPLFAQVTSSPNGGWAVEPAVLSRQAYEQILAKLPITDLGDQFIFPRSK